MNPLDLSKVPLGPVKQIGIVVEDIVASCSAYDATFAGGDWVCYTYDSQFVRDLTFRGEPGDFSMHIAMGGADPQVELIQPVAGRSLYTEHLEQFGPGLHHLGVYVDDLGAAVARMAAMGFPVIQSGRGYGLDGDGGFAYFDTLRATGTIFEAIERPRRRREPRPLSLLGKR
jgi:catechol 2,3-dioxygenase-like lactoylglutathione lyase family enzyme